MFVFRPSNVENNISINNNSRRNADNLLPLAQQFMSACTVNDRSKIDAILKRRKDRKVYGRFGDNNLSPLHYAVLNGSPEAVRAVLVYQRNISILQVEYEYGYTALALACSIPDIAPDIIACILEARPRAATIIDYQNKTPLDLLWENRRYGLLSVFTERIQKHLSEISRNPSAILQELFAHQQAWQPIINDGGCQSFWRVEIMFALLSLDFPIYLSILTKFKAILAQISTGHQILFLCDCARGVNEYIHENMNRIEAVSDEISRKLFHLMHCIKDSSMFMSRGIFFEKICANANNLSTNMVYRIVAGVRPFISPMNSLASHHVYNVMESTLPFKFLRRRDARCLSLKALARDAVRSSYPSFFINKEVVQLYKSFCQAVPKLIASYILYIEDHSWIEGL